MLKDYSELNEIIGRFFAFSWTICREQEKYPRKQKILMKWVLLLFGFEKQIKLLFIERYSNWWRRVGLANEECLTSTDSKSTYCTYLPAMWCTAVTVGKSGANSWTTRHVEVPWTRAVSKSSERKLPDPRKHMTFTGTQEPLLKILAIFCESGSLLTKASALNSCGKSLDRSSSIFNILS